MKLTKQSSNSTERKSTAKANATEEKSQPDMESQNSRIAVSAYYKAQARGFEPGYELEDWLAAEAKENQWILFPLPIIRVEKNLDEAEVLIE